MVKLKLTIISKLAKSGTEIPVITIDGPAGSGKGTTAKLVADRLGFNILDSGLLYRVVGYQISQESIDYNDTNQVDRLVADLANRTDLWELASLARPQLRSQAVSDIASAISKVASVRQLLLPVQRNFRKPPGLVADGRDMATVVFPDALVKIFLTASEQVRAQRRSKQLQGAKMDDCLRAIRQRDLVDRSRQLSPMVADKDAIEIDSTRLKPEQVVDQIVKLYSKIEKPH